MEAIDTQSVLSRSDEQLLAECDLHTYKSSGPGGQHRNKVSSAVRLLHRPSGVSAHGDDSRSQHDNKRMALRRLRMNIACQIRNGYDPEAPLPQVVRDCLHTPKKAADSRNLKVLQIGRRDERFWQIAAFLLDVLDARQGRLADVAAQLGVTTGNVTRVLQADRHVLAAAQQVRKAHGQRPIA